MTREFLDLLTRLQAAAQPIDPVGGDLDARIPAALWREFVDAHADALYENEKQFPQSHADDGAK